MRNDLRNGVAAAAVAVFLVLQASGASADGFGRRGFYVGVGGAAGVDFFKSQIENAFGSLDVEADVSNTWGVNARVGYRLLSFVALEAQYEYMHSFETDVSGTISQIPFMAEADLTTHTVTGNLKLIIPTWRIQPYLLLGLGAQYGKFEGAGLTGDILDLLGVDQSDDWAIAGRPGLGLDLYITKNLVMNAEVAGVLSAADYETPGSSVNDIFYLSAGGGLQWRF